MTHLHLTWLLFRKDLLIEARSREIVGFMLLFSVLCVVIFAFAFLTDADRARLFLPGVLWVTLLFSGTVGLLRLFAREDESGTLGICARSRAGALPLYWSKVAVQIAFSGIVTACVTPLAVVFFDAEVPDVGLSFAALALGILGQSFVGTLCSALLVTVRLREVLLPLVLYPLLSPLFIGGVKMTSIVLSRTIAEDYTAWLGLMVAFDVIFMVASPAVFTRLRYE